ncbi:hypothetical protein JTB14_024337 [Gonioctena quinquepunctata]|nr:hypothetical protein JTB14_024337 [Gonioctena quinquepunctata]
MLPVFADRFRRVNRRMENLRLLRIRARIRRENNAFDLPERRFIELFRLNKDLVRQLLALVRPHLPEHGLERGISIENYVLVALRFYATGSYQRSLGQDFNFGMSQSSISQCIHRVTDVIDEHLPGQFIQLPNTRDERQVIKATYMDRHSFPGAVGAIDCTHIAILKPREDEHNFINRKGYHSLNVQIICDPNLKILNINANYGGSTNDAFIWRYSNVRRYMQHIHNMGETNSWLIGDSGYPLQPFLMTPINDVEPHAAAVRYNQAHASARNGVERTIGLCKMRFRCLLKERVARYEPIFVSKMITVCAILHNMC